MKRRPSAHSSRGVSVFEKERICALAGLRLNPGCVDPSWVDDTWDLTGLTDVPRSCERCYLIWDFASIFNSSWRSVAKDAAVALLCPDHPKVNRLPNAYRNPRKPHTVFTYIRQWAEWLNWLDGIGIESLADVDQDLCDQFLDLKRWTVPKAGSARRQVAPGHLKTVVKALQGIVYYNDLFTADRFDRDFFPWGRHSANTVAGVITTPHENTTPLVPTEILQPLLANCLYLVETIGPKFRELLVDYRETVKLAPKLTSRKLFKDDEISRVEAFIEHCKSSGTALPAVDPSNVRYRLRKCWRPDDPLLQMSFLSLYRLAGLSTYPTDGYKQIRSILEAGAAHCGLALPWGRDADLVPRANDATLIPWTEPMSGVQIQVRERYLRGSCLIITAAVSGMRRSELMELGMGGRSESVIAGGGRRYSLLSKRIKGLALGGVQDEWVVVQEVDNAVALAEFLGETSKQTLFGGVNIANFVEALRSWVNSAEGVRLGLAQLPAGPVNGRMLRRTLAVELATRPAGLIAAKVHLKHVSIATTEGYAARPGGSQAQFLSEVERNEKEHHLRLTMAAYAEYRDGIMPAGPGATSLIGLFNSVDRAIDADPVAAPQVVSTDRVLENLLRAQAGALHVGPANYCWFKDPSKALCLRLAGDPGGSKPLIGLCDSARCPQATHHPQHREVWLASVESLSQLLENNRVSKFERDRIALEVERAKRVVASIDTAVTTNNERD